MADTHDHEHADEDANCEEALADLYTFLDGELTDEKRIVIQHHLDDCSPCLEVYDFEAELRLVIKKRCVDEVPDRLRKLVAERLTAIEADGGGQPARFADG